MVHHDLHTGNILILPNDIVCLDTDYIPDVLDKICISDMGLCREVGDIKNTDETKIYGVMPYVAPEVLKGKPYTQAADIYSLGMIMYFIATGRQPFANCAHDNILALKICNGIRPEINEQEIPKVTL
ncbi:kinase-like domain-containing protein, partial [Rhizophagus diaphanus]